MRAHHFVCNEGNVSTVLHHQSGRREQSTSMEIQMNTRAKIIGASFVLFLAVSAEAQSSPMRLPSVAVEPNARADQLREEAKLYYSKVTTLRKAAVLHEREAAARVESDPLKFAALDLAARLYAYAGDPARGTALMEQAARGALTRGDVKRAAHALLDAAFLALKVRDGERARELTHQADLLALSPLLTPDEKLSIVQRINPARGDLGAAAR